MARKLYELQVDEQGRIVLDERLRRELGLQSGASVCLEVDGGRLRLHTPLTHLQRVYVEPTNACNLDCRTCMRSVWDEPLGRMSAETFGKVLEGLRSFSPPPTVFFGGFGEPLSHPGVLEMVRQAKALGGPVELITNGTLLTEEVSRALVRLGLDRLWVSLDGARPESYEDVRLGALLPQVLDNLAKLYLLRLQAYNSGPKLGIAFVAMQRNIGDLPELVRLGERLGADRFSISNVMAHTTELQQEMLYTRAVDTAAQQQGTATKTMDLPRIDINSTTLDPLAFLLRGGHNIRLNGQELPWLADACPFVERGSLSVRWDGAVSPCLPLLHRHVSFLGERLRQAHAYAVDTLEKRSLQEIWLDPGYVDLRRRLQHFDFAPCTSCNSCELADANLEDCYNNPLPACGGCLWAQGVIQCP